MTSYNKNDLILIANRTGFLRDQLEKVIRLTEVLRFFQDDELLSQSLVLKGGTAINMTVFQMPRLSVDIDLDYCRDVSRDIMLEEREQITRKIQSHMAANGYVLSPNTKNPHSLDSWVFDYMNAGNNHDVIKIEINYSMRCHILPAIEKEVHLDFTEPFKVHSLHPIELFGSKIKALLERCACRDMYDVYNMLSAGMFTSDAERDLLKRIVTFYRCVGGNTIPVKPIYTSNIEAIRFPQIRSQLLPVLKKTERFDFEKAKQMVISFINNDISISEQEQLFIDSFNRGEYLPEILFGEEDILSRIAHHPMALWKTKR